MRRAGHWIPEAVPGCPGSGYQPGNPEAESREEEEGRSGGYSSLGEDQHLRGNVRGSVVQEQMAGVEG